MYLCVNVYMHMFVHVCVCAVQCSTSKQCPPIVYVYILMYTFGRFFIEFLRGDDRGNMYYGMSPSQTMCLIIFLMVMFSKDGRGLHDILAMTKVIDLKAKPALESEIIKPKKEEHNDE